MSTKPEVEESAEEVVDKVLPSLEKSFQMDEPSSKTPLTFQYFSCTNIEATSFQATRIPKSADYLILSGNISAFAYHYNQHFYEYLCKTWRGVFLVPGPQEFAGGPMELGLKTCIALENEVSSTSNFKILSRERGSFIFPEHKVRLIGARLWGKKGAIYRDRKIAETLEKSDAEITNAVAASYSNQDCDYLVSQMKLAKDRGERVIVVTHGCPSKKLCKKLSEDSKCYTLSVDVKKELLGDLSPEFWIYGASGDKAGTTLKTSKTLYCVNDYDPFTDSFRTKERAHVVSFE